MAELSGLEVLALVKELDFGLRGAYVNNIYSAGGSQILRLRRPGGGDVWAVASPGEGVWISEKVSERGETTEFTSKLRSELDRARFVSAGQLGLDRIFELRFMGREARTMVVELMPPGNVVILDGEGRVRLALREVRTLKRRVTRGLMYQAPPTSRLSPSELSADEVRKMAGSEKTAGAAVGRRLALPRKYVVEILARLGMQEASSSSGLADRAEEVVEVASGVVREAVDHPSPSVCETGSGVDVFAIRPKAFALVRGGPSLSSLCDELLLAVALAPHSEERSSEDRRREELGKTISRLSESERRFADQAREIREAARVAEAAGLEGANKSLAEFHVIPREAPRSAKAAASLLFDRAKELEGKAEEARKARLRLETEVPRARKTAKKSVALPREEREWFEKFRWFKTSSGKLALGGRDAQSNSTLVRRHLQAGDTVYHADLFGSPFFVLKEGKGQTEEDVMEVAQATVAFSSAWKTGLGVADAYWVEPSQVEAGAPSGEYLARGSFAIRGRKNFVRKVVVEIALGVEGAGRVVAGPEHAVSRTVLAGVVLKPHNEKSSETAKKVAKDLRDALGEHANISLDDVLRALPAGGGKVIRRLAGKDQGPQGRT